MVMICDHSQVELLDYPNHRYFAVCAAAEEESADGGGTRNAQKGGEDGGVGTVDSGGSISPARVRPATRPSVVPSRRPQAPLVLIMRSVSNEVRGRVAPPLGNSFGFEVCLAWRTNSSGRTETTLPRSVTPSFVVNSMVCPVTTAPNSLHFSSTGGFSA